MATEFPQRPTCGKCVYFDKGAYEDSSKGTCNYAPAMLAAEPVELDGGPVWYSLPDPDVRTERVACTEYVVFSTRALQ